MCRYHEESLKQMKFFDDNTRSWWTPVTGGANVPALNDLLAPHNILLGEKILHGKAVIGGKHSLEVSVEGSFYRRAEHIITIPYPVLKGVTRAALALSLSSTGRLQLLIVTPPCFQLGQHGDASPLLPCRLPMAPTLPRFLLGGICMLLM